MLKMLLAYSHPCLNVPNINKHSCKYKQYTSLSTLIPRKNVLIHIILIISLSKTKGHKNFTFLHIFVALGAGMETFFLTALP